MLRRYFSPNFTRNVTLLRPSQRALARVTGANDTSVMRLENVALEEPLRGSMLTHFPNVVYKNITSDMCRQESKIDRFK